MSLRTHLPRSLPSAAQSELCVCVDWFGAAIFQFEEEDVCITEMSRRGGGGRRDDAMSGANNAPLGGGSGGGLMARAGAGGGGGSLLKPAYLQQGKIKRSGKIVLIFCVEM